MGRGLGSQSAGAVPPAPPPPGGKLALQHLQGPEDGHGAVCTTSPSRRPSLLFGLSVLRGPRAVRAAGTQPRPVPAAAPAPPPSGVLLGGSADGHGERVPVNKPTLAIQPRKNMKPGGTRDYGLESGS